MVMDPWPLRPPKYFVDKDSANWSCKKGLISTDQQVWPALQGMVKFLKRTKNQNKVSNLQHWVLVLLMCANSKLIMLNLSIVIISIKKTNNTAYALMTKAAELVTSETREWITISILQIGARCCTRKKGRSKPQRDRKPIKTGNKGQENNIIFRSNINIIFRPSRK